MHRRHLDDSQRAWVGENIAKLPSGGQIGNVSAAKEHGLENESANLPTRFSVSDAAAAVNVSPRLIGDAKHVKESGHECLHQAVVDGDLPVSTAAKFTSKRPSRAGGRARANFCDAPRDPARRAFLKI